MRQSTAVRLILPVLAAGIALAGCSSGTGAKRTSTVVETYTASGATGTAAGTGGTPSVPTGSVQVTVSQPATSSLPTSSSSEPSSTKTSASPSKSPTTTTKKSTTAGPIQKVDPLSIDCTAILTPADVKKIGEATIPAATNRVKDVANEKVDSTGSVRCRYGVTGDKQKLSMRLTDYKTADAAKKQMNVNIESEKDLGARSTEVTVGGRPAVVLLRDGGLINVLYDDWTLAIATDAGLLSGDEVEKLTGLADLALQRILKNADS